MTDLSEARALAAAARADTSDGLLARERLADIVDELAGIVEELRDALGRPTTQWAARWRDGGNWGVEWRDDEQDAREFVASMPANVRLSWSVVSRTLHRRASPWVEVPAGVEVGGG